MALTPAVGHADEALQRAQSRFLADTVGDTASLHTLWLTPPLQEQLQLVFGHRYPALRVRYWQNAARTAWVLEAIGKEEPITVGLAVEAGKLLRVSVLAYRESRGGEVQQRSFTTQFSGVGLRADRQLDKPIDGITGATLSVNALQKLARVALLFDQQVPRHDSAAQADALK